jgi:hypothetical protein
MSNVVWAQPLITAPAPTAQLPTSVSFSFNASGVKFTTTYLPNRQSVIAQLSHSQGNIRRMQQLLSIPVAVTTTVTVTPMAGGDPVMSLSQTEDSVFGVPVFKWQVNQGFSDNGSVITSVAPLNDVGTSVYYPGWSLSNFTWGTSQPATGVYSGQSNANFIFSYSPLKLITIETTNVNVTLRFYANNYWTVHGSTSFL